MMKKDVLIWVVFLWCCGAWVGGCRLEPKPTERYDRPLGPGQVALRKVDPSEIPDFTGSASNLVYLQQAARNSLVYLNKPSAKGAFPVAGVSHERAIASVQGFVEMLDSGLRGEQLNRAIRQHFDVYESVGCDDEGTVLFTGYYTPVFDGRLERGGRFQYPLYQQPRDLLKGADGKILGQKMGDGSVRPYPSRGVIESSGMLKGKELVWLADPFEVYISHVQGSAKVRKEDGQIITIGYAATNGHEYKSISEKLVKDGKIPAEKMSLAAMIDFFKQFPHLVDRYTRENPRFVFFRFEDGEPRGSLNVPVTAMRSIATDKSIFPRGCVCFISTHLPRNLGGKIVQRPFTGFMVDQDTGGAIRAPGRCDVYMGQGDTAGKLAGSTWQEGKLYYLLLKER